MPAGGPTALGIDVGSLTTKAVLLGDSRILASAVVPTGDEASASVTTVLQEALKLAGMAPSTDSLYCVATGAGARDVAFARQQKTVTTCLARGVHELLTSVRMAIDIGAESSCVIKLSDKGRLNDCASHDKCAAGTGIFLQQMARLMQMPLADMSRISLQARSKADISGTCAVFAESEVISHVHRDPPTAKEAIAAGIYLSVVSRLMALCKRIGIEKDVAVVGGVAWNAGLVRILEEEIGFNVLVPENPQIVAALGAAVVARESIQKGMK